MVLAYVSVPLIVTHQEQQEYEQKVAEARAALGDAAAFDAAWAEGLALTMEQAVEYALESTNA